MADNYEFSKSVFPQGIDSETPYSSLQFNYINDINGGVYSNNGLSLVQFDLSSIYNSASLVDPSKMFITVPVTMVSQYCSSLSAGTAVAPTLATGAWATQGLKCGYWNLLHGADLIVSNKTVEQFQPNINTYINFKMISSMSQDDLKTYGTSLGMGDQLDNPQSMKFNPASGVTTGSAAAWPGVVLTAGCVGGNGMTNNLPYGLTNPNAGDQTLFSTAQGTGTYNAGYYSRLKKYSDTSNGTYQNLFGATAGTGASMTSLMTETQIQNEFKPYFKISGNYMITYDVAVIRMCDIFDSMKSMCLMKKWDGIIRLYFNTGAVGSSVAILAGGSGMITSSSTSTFTNTCPLLQSCFTGAPVGSIGLVSGLFISKATNTTIFGVNLGASNASHSMSACRMYYPQVQLKPEKLIPYISENRAKKICYTSVLFNAFNGITSGSTFSALVQSGVTAIRGVLIIPFISASVNGSFPSTAVVTTGVNAFSQVLSPFDTAPATSAPISLINLQVSVGGVNQLSNTLSYTYENFLEQVSLYEKINGADIGLSCGLVNQQFWDTSRSYYVDCSRGNVSDNLSARNVNISFNNNSNATIDIMVFTEYFKEMIVDVETGLISGL